MADRLIPLRKELVEALEAEASIAGLSTEALVEEAIARHLEARKTLAHFAALRASADLEFLDRALAREGGEEPADDDRVPAKT